MGDGIVVKGHSSTETWQPTVGLTCKMVKVDEMFEKCAGGDKKTCLERLKTNSFLGELVKYGADSFVNEKADIAKCPDKDGYYFKFGDALLALCGAASPRFGEQKIVSSGETFKCEGSIMFGVLMVKELGAQCGVKNTVEKEDNTQVFSLLDALRKKEAPGLAGFRNPYITDPYRDNIGVLSGDDSDAVITNSERDDLLLLGAAVQHEPDYTCKIISEDTCSGQKTVLVEGPCDKMKIVETKFEGTDEIGMERTAGGVIFGLEDLDNNVLEKAGLIVDAMIEKGVEALGYAKIKIKELENLAVCGKDELCSGKQKIASALLDAYHVREYITKAK